MYNITEIIDFILKNKNNIKDGDSLTTLLFKNFGSNSLRRILKQTGVYLNEKYNINNDFLSFDEQIDKYAEAMNMTAYEALYNLLVKIKNGEIVEKKQ